MIFHSFREVEVEEIEVCVRGDRKLRKEKVIKNNERESTGIIRLEMERKEIKLRE